MTTRWGDRLAVSLRERMSSVVVATALAALIVLGVLTVLIIAVRGAETTYSQANAAVAVAQVTEDGIRTTTALQKERALGSLLTYSSDYLTEYRAAVAATDAAIQDLRVTWARNRELIPETATPPISDVLAAEAALADFRGATETPSGESTFSLYTEMVGMSLSATAELVKAGDTGTGPGNPALVVALLTASEAMQNQRYLVQETLASGEPMSEEARLQLDVISNNLTQSLFEARSLAEGDNFDSVQEIMTGTAAELTGQLLAAIIATDADRIGVTPEQWYEASSTRIALVEELVPTINAEQATLVLQNREGAQRALWTRSILLGALFVLSILVASNAVFATRERGEALAEYGQLTDGLRQWFVAASFPDTESVDIAARYEPASVRTMSGGDWYDVYNVEDSLAVVIGDIAGHGAEATAQMAQLRNILRGQSTARSLQPSEQIDLLSRTVAHSGIIATLTSGLLDQRGRFTYTRAGHIPLLIRSASGSVRIEEEAGGPPVGSGVEMERGQHVTRLRPGDVLILITDGLVEGVNRENIDIGLDEIAKALTEAPHSMDEMLERLFSMSPGQANDDTAALLITWRGQGGESIEA